MMNFLYTNHTKHIELKDFNEQVDLWFFGDVHRDTSACDDDRWEQFLKKAKKSENAYYVGMGDYHDFASSSEKKSLRHANLHETTMEKLDEVVMKMNRKFAGEIGFMRDRLLCLVEGNHNWVFPNGQTSTDDLAQRMGTINVGWLSHFTLLFDFKNRPNQTVAVRMVLCHGKAGGKTAGITITQVDDMKRIFPVADIYCVSDDTQILTTDGWKYRSDMAIGDTVYSLDGYDTLVESKVKNKIEYHHDGDVVKIKNRNTDQILTPEHRVYYRQSQTPYEDKWLIDTADHLSDMASQIVIPLAGNIKSVNTEYSHDLLSLVGWIIAEGHFKGKKGDHGVGILIYQKHKTKARLIERTLDNLEIAYTKRINTEDVTVFYIKKESAVWIRKIISSKERLPEWVYKLSSYQFESLFSAMVLGDGSFCNGTNCGTYYSVHEKLIDDLQMACAIHGIRTIKRFKKGGFNNGCYVISFCFSNTVQLNSKLRISKEHYNGMVWCIETEHGNFVARRNGYTFITGNCQGHDHQLGAWPVSVLVPNWKNEIKQKRQLLCRSGSFKKTYEHNKSSYEVGKLFKPADLGALKLTVSFNRNRKDGADTVNHYIEATI